MTDAERAKLVKQAREEWLQMLELIVRAFPLSQWQSRKALAKTAENILDKKLERIRFK